MQCILPSQRCISSRQMTDNILEIETHCSGPRRVCSSRLRCPSDSLCCCIYQCQSPLDLLGAREHWIARLPLPLFTKHLQGQHHTRGICGSRTRTILDAQRSTTRLFCGWLSFLQWPLTRSSDGSKNQLSQGTSAIWTSCSLHNVLKQTISLFLHLPFES